MRERFRNSDTDGNCTLQDWLDKSAQAVPSRMRA